MTKAKDADRRSPDADVMQRCEKHYHAGGMKQCWNRATQWTMEGPHKAYYCDHCSEIVKKWGCEMTAIL